MALSPDDFPPVFKRTDVGGVKVVSDVVYESPLSKSTGTFIPMTGVRVLTLEDGTVVLGCRDCEELGRLGHIRQHRRVAHEESLGGGRRTRKSDDPAGEQITLTAGAGALTVREIVDLSVHVDDWAVLLAGAQEREQELVEERNNLRGQLRAATRELESLKKKIARAMGLQIVSTPEEE